MADQQIGITFMPSADAAANGPRQAGIEGQSGSDLSEAFKILSLHLPRVLGASAIAPKRLLTSPGSAAIAAASGLNPYAAVFQALLQQLGGGGNPSTGSDVNSMASLYGMRDVDPNSVIGAQGGSGANSGGLSSYQPGGAAPPPHIDATDSGRVPTDPSGSESGYAGASTVSGTTFPTYENYGRVDTQYI